MFAFPPKRKSICSKSTWYEEAQPGLGTLFLDSVETALNYVAQNPLAGREVHARSGECSLTDFRTGSPIRSRKMPSLSLDASTCAAIPQCGGPVPLGRRTHNKTSYISQAADFMISMSAINCL